MSLGLRFIHRHDDSAICFESGCEQYAGPASGWRPEEAEAIRASAGVDLTSRQAGLVRALLAERLGDGMVTNELVAITTLAAQSEGERVQLTSEPGADAARWRPTGSAAVAVEQIPLPWRHSWGTVVGLEYPADRPAVVDLVFGNGLRSAETKGALYAEHPARGVWDYAAEVGIPYAEAGTDRYGYHLVCPECGARCRPEPSAIESLSPGDRATYEDAVTKGASYAYSVHYEREHGKGQS